LCVWRRHLSQRREAGEWRAQHPKKKVISLNYSAADGPDTASSSSSAAAAAAGASEIRDDEFEWPGVFTSSVTSRWNDGIHSRDTSSFSTTATATTAGGSCATTIPVDFVCSDDDSSPEFHSFPFDQYDDDTDDTIGNASRECTEDAPFAATTV